MVERPAFLFKAQIQFRTLRHGVKAGEQRERGKGSGRPQDNRRHKPPKAEKPAANNAFANAFANARKGR